MKWSALSRRVAGAALIILVTALAYYPCLRGTFILDDQFLVADNSLIKASDGLYKFWCTAEAIDYWPVFNTTLWLEWRLWGTNPIGYHLINLALFVSEVLLIWLLLHRLSIPGAFLAALLFAVHPVNVQSVAWISECKNLLATIFFLLSIFCFIHAAGVPPSRRGSRLVVDGWYWSSLTAFVLAMLSKGSVAMLPVILLVILWWVRPITKRDLAGVAPFFAVPLILVPVNVWFQARVLDSAGRNVAFVERLLTAAHVIWFYLGKAVLPIHLSFVYPQWHADANQVQSWLPLSATVAVTGLLWWYRQSWSRPLLFAWAYFCISLTPVMGFARVVFMVKQSLVADHYQHIALIGIVALVAAGLSVWRERSSGLARWGPIAGAAAVTGVFALLTWQQSGVYRDGVTLFQAVLKENPASPLVENDMGFMLREAGRLQEATKHFERALQLDPNYADAHNNLGGTLAQLGERRQAIAHFEHAILLRPDFPAAENNLGAMLRETGRPQDAIDHLQQALRRTPNFAEAHSNLAKALLELGRRAESIEHFQIALQLRPDDHDARRGLEAALANAAEQNER